MSNSTDGRAGRTAYWITTAVSAAAFAIPGAANLAHVPHIASDMAHLGYPPYFLTLLGTWKLAAAIAILVPRFPRLKEWAYAGMIFDLTGAAASRAAMHDGAAMIVIPLLIAAVVFLSWATRPDSRKLRPN